MMMAVALPEIDITDLRQTGGVSPEEALRVIADKMPPIARKVVLIDFDDTIAPFGYMFSFPEPFEGIVEFTKLLKSRGYSIGIFTSRLSPTWLASAGLTGEEQREYITNYCNMYGILFDFMGAEKVPCEAYIDDKAIYFNNNWAELTERWRNAE